MQLGIKAILYHRASSSSKPQHQYCPTGEQSWCGYQRDLAKQTQEYEHHDVLPEAVVKCIAPVFDRLSKKELLDKCLHGGTQNRNESFHNVVWAVTPEVHYQKYSTFASSVHLAICLWNSGATVISTLLKSLDITPGKHTEHAIQKEDEKNI